MNTKKDTKYLKCIHKVKINEKNNKKLFHPLALIFIVFLNVIHPFLTNFFEIFHYVGVFNIDEELHSKLIFLVTQFVNKIKSAKI